MGRGTTPPILTGDNRNRGGNATIRASRQKRRIDHATDSDRKDNHIEPRRTRPRRVLVTPSDSPSNLPGAEANGSTASDLQPQTIIPTNEPPRADPAYAGSQGQVDSHSVRHQGPDSSTPTLIDSNTTTPELDLGHPFPYVESIAPNRGTILGGTWVHVIGRNFLRTDRILFGRVAATTTIYQSETAMRCLSPRYETPGPVPISVDGVPLIVGGGRGDEQLSIFTYEDDIPHQL